MKESLIHFFPEHLYSSFTSYLLRGVSGIVLTTDTSFRVLMNVASGRLWPEENADLQGGSTTSLFLSVSLFLSPVFVSISLSPSTCVSAFLIEFLILTLFLC